MQDKRITFGVNQKANQYNCNYNNDTGNNDFKSVLLTSILDGIFKPNTEKQKKEETPDLLEEMEKFLNEPFENKEEEKKNGVFAGIIAEILVSGFFSYINNRSENV